MGSPAANVAYAKKCKEVDILQAKVSAAHAAIYATVLLIPPRTRSQKGKATGKDLIKKFKDLANKLKKKTAEHDALLQGIVLERKECEDTLKQTTASVGESIAGAVRREKTEAREQLVMETSQMDDHIRQLSRQLKHAEDKIAQLNVGLSPGCISTILVPAWSPLRTPFVTPTRVSA